ncbi:MAG: hypothetical protein M3P49_04830 [Actinomycetota bacterium]|nr:hypothetical protein [Actinomycetota bacterium]
MLYRSSVERYRAGESTDLAYDFSHPVDRAIWTAVGLYVDRREMVRLAGGEPLGIEPWELEETLEELAAHALGEARMRPREARVVARRVVDALFSDGGGLAVIPAEFWAVGGEPGQELPESALVPDGAISALSRMIRAAYGDLVSQADVARRLGILRSSAKEKLERRGVPVVRVGRRVYVPEVELEGLEG